MARAERRRRANAFLLVLPLLAFVLISFVFPIGDMLLQSAWDPTISNYMPRTVELLENWDERGGDLPDEAVFESTAEELVSAYKEKAIGKIATRLNYDLTAIRSVVNRTARRLNSIETTSYKETMLGIDKRWGESETWTMIKKAGRRFTAAFYLGALDFEYDAKGDIVRKGEERRIYVTLYLRTAWVSALITLVGLLLAYPLSYVLATVPVRISNVLIMFVLLPFWTSLLVRTTSWIVLLQTHGVLNDAMVWLGLIDDKSRVQMIYNMFGTVVAMTQILLPFMVLPLFSTMKTISPYHVRAAKSLGASPAKAFWTVYFPQTLPGIGAGSLLVFILAVGYYITPALVGGRTGQLISNLIAFHMQHSLNWGLATALGAILLVGVLALYWLYNRIIGIDKLALG